MALSKWFETKGSKPAAKAPPKRRHFAAITMAPETRPSRLSEARSLKTQDSKGGSFKPPLGPCGRRAHGFDLKILLSFLKSHRFLGNDRPAILNYCACC